MPGSKQAWPIVAACWCHAAQRHRRAEHAGLGGAEIGVAVAHLRQQGGGDAEQAQQLLVPSPAADVEEHGARGIGRIRRMHPTAGEPPQKETIHRAEGQRPAFRRSARARHVVEQPGELGGGEIGVGEQARALGQQRLHTLGAQPGAMLGGATVLPDDGAMHAVTARAVPEQHGLALVGDADAGDARGRRARPGQRTAQRGQGAAPDVLGVVLDPARGREVLRQFLLRRGARAQRGIEGDAARARRALVEGEQQVLGHARPILRAPS